MKEARAHVSAVQELRRFAKRQLQPADTDLTEGELPHHVDEIRRQLALPDKLQEGLSRLECRDHRASRGERAAIIEAHAARLVVVHQYFCDRTAGEYLAAMRLDIARHRVRQLLAAALGYCLAVDVDCRDHDVEGLAGAFLVGKNLRRQRPVEHHRLDEVVLEVHFDPRARRQRRTLDASNPRGCASSARAIVEGGEGGEKNAFRNPSFISAKLS